MSEEEKKIVETVENFIKYYKKNEQIGNRANLDVLREECNAIEFILNKYDIQQEELKQEKEKNTLINHLYKNLKDDFDNYKKDKDINYLDNNHHKELVEKSIGQIINKPEECWFDAVEVKIIRNNILYGVNIDKDFITLKEISDEHPDMCMTVIAESPLSGAIYRYNSYGKKEWQLVGTMYGYA